MSIGDIKQYGVGGTISQSEFKELQNDGDIKKGFQFAKYDLDGDGKIEQKEVDKLESGRTDRSESRDEPARGGSADIVQGGKFDKVKTLNVGAGSHYVVIHTSHANNKSKDIGSISGKGVSIVSRSGDGDNGIIIAKVNGPASVRIDSNNAGSGQYAVVKSNGDITAFGGDDAGYPKGGNWSKVNGTGDAFYIAAGHAGTPTFYSTEKNKVHGNTVTARS